MTEALRDASDLPAMIPFDAGAVPLEGLALIEASAGTGKTFTITSLFLRLVLEAGLEPERILVVTYTRAATAELRDRIRARLRAARLAFRSGSTDDRSLDLLLRHCEDRVLASKRLDHALHTLDEAAVYTIHGFCQRALTDHAFESGARFGMEIVADDSALVREVIEDYWRGAMEGAPTLWAEFLVARRRTPPDLVASLTPFLGKPYLFVEEPSLADSLEDCALAASRSYAHVRALWLRHRDTVMRSLTESRALNGNKYRKSSVQTWLDAMDVYLQRESPDIDLFDGAVKFTQSALNAGARKGQKAPQHPVFDAWEDFILNHEALLTACERRWVRLQFEALTAVRRELHSRKHTAGIRSYDDLLIELYEALSGKTTGSLHAGLRAQYRAALIDEFQDTDPIQFRIFSEIFADTGAPVFLVGDPKQAIYSFRGADLFSYLEGRTKARRRYTLHVNWRSTAELIRAVNTLFEWTDHVFRIPGIHYQSVEPCDETRVGSGIGGSGALRFFRLSTDGGSPLSKSVAMERAAETAAGEIALLLRAADPRTCVIDDRALEGGDIAVLVPTRRHAERMQRALRDLGIASVRHTQDSVFHTHEAEEVERILMAVAAPEDGRLLRGALCTDLLGVSGRDLHALMGDEPAWDERAARFQSWHQQWVSRGFIQMFSTMLEEEGAVRRLLQLPDGERRVANLFQLMELLQKESLRARIGPERVLAWLHARRRDEHASSEEYQQRLESDEQLVQIITIHKSKGLEFPVVFCPFLWDVKQSFDSGGALSFHDPGRDGRPVLSFDPDAAAQGQYRLEREAEGVRLLYVALTRARYRVYVVWGDIKGATESALGRILHSGGDQASHERADASVLDRLVVGSGGSISVSDAPAPRTATGERVRSVRESLRAREFGGRIDRSWWVASYSGLVSRSGGEAPDFDAYAGYGPSSGSETSRGIFAFPRGAWSGQCIHAIFERVDFTAAGSPEVARVVARTLLEFGFDRSWAPVMTETVERVLQTDLVNEVRLRGVGAGDRLSELEFYFPVSRFDAEGFQAVIDAQAKHRPDSLYARCAASQFGTVHGYLKGYIDLVFRSGGRFYLADYKSNWLGESPDAYSGEALSRAMVDEGYMLQLLIYTLALHRYLKSRMPDYSYGEHFGGAFYLFVRGMDPRRSDRCGVFAESPPENLILALDAWMAEAQ